MKYKKLEHSQDIMEDFNTFFNGTFKVVEVGVIGTTRNHKELLFCKCGYNGLALNRKDGNIYLKYENNKGEQFILLEGRTIIIDDDETIYVTSDIGLQIISKGNIENELKRLKEYNLDYPNT